MISYVSRAINILKSYFLLIFEFQSNASEDLIANTLADQLRSFMSDFGCPNGLSTMGFDRRATDQLAEAALNSFRSNPISPREIDYDSIANIYEKSMTVYWRVSGGFTILPFSQPKLWFFKNSYVENVVHLINYAIPQMPCLYIVIFLFFWFHSLKIWTLMGSHSLFMLLHFLSLGFGQGQLAHSFHSSRRWIDHFHPLLLGWCWSCPPASSPTSCPSCSRPCSAMVSPRQCSGSIFSILLGYFVPFIIKFQNYF